MSSDLGLIISINPAISLVYVAWSVGHSIAHHVNQTLTRQLPSQQISVSLLYSKHLNISSSSSLVQFYQFYFNRIMKIWNSLPTIDINQSYVTIKNQVFFPSSGNFFLNNLQCWHTSYVGYNLFLFLSVHPYFSYQLLISTLSWLKLCPSISHSFIIY